MSGPEPRPLAASSDEGGQAAAQQGRAPILSPWGRRGAILLVVAAGALMVADAAWLDHAVFGSRLWHAVQWGLVAAGLSIGLWAQRQR